MKTQITIYCKDGTVRKIQCVGKRNNSFAEELGRDIERGNYKSSKAETL